LPDRDESQIQKLTMLKRSGNEGLYIEETTMQNFSMSLTERVKAGAAGDKLQDIGLGGVIADYSQIPAAFSGQGYAYANQKTLKKLGIEPSQNVIYIKLTGTREIKDISMEIESELKKDEIYVSRTVSDKQTDDVRKAVVETVMILLLALGGISSILGIVLVSHLFNRMFSQQTVELSVYKALGATKLYFLKQLSLTVFMLGTISWLTSLLISWYVSSVFSAELIERLNFAAVPYSFSLEIGLLLGLIAYVIPMISIIVPFWKVLRIPAARGMQRISGTSAMKTKKKGSRYFSIGTLSFRQVKTKKWQWATNVMTLSFGGAVIIACIALYSSLLGTIAQIQQFWDYELEWTVENTMSQPELKRITQQANEIKTAEGWMIRNTEVKHDQEEAVHNARLVALNENTELIKPDFQSGDWFHKENEVVVNQDIAEQAGKTLKPGDQIWLKAAGEEKQWTISGIIHGQLEGPAVYMDFEDYGKWTSSDHVNRLAVETNQEIRTAVNEIEGLFEKNGIAVQAFEESEDRKERPKQIIGMVVFALFSTGALFVVIGAVNVMTTMSVNVLERKKEIGIIRSIGGSKWKVYGLFLREGILISVISWAFAVALSYPLYLFLSKAIGQTLLNGSLQHVFPMFGIWSWLGASIVTGMISGYFPSRKAVNQPLRELLVRSE
jgi:ABC-type antimicrobial peptide transport system permease subunit